MPIMAAHSAGYSGLEMRYEVDVIVHHPLNSQVERFLASIQRSANTVLRYRGDDKQIVLTVEAHAYDPEGARRTAVQEVAHVYPLERFEARGVPRPR